MNNSLLVFFQLGRRAGATNLDWKQYLKVKLIVKGMDLLYVPWTMGIQFTWSVLILATLQAIGV